ncbi:MAG: bifunctional precorrin-2 dehydrogenase/sirohydrochlorin ferrochelatase [Alphaproteobacteria bacterium]
MFPMLVDLKAVPVALAGNGDAALGRLKMLDGEGAQVTVYAPVPSEALEQAAGKRLVRQLPRAEDISLARILFIAGIEKADAERLAGEARRAGVFVNTEDDPPLCDFHVPAIVRRGDLVLTVSTGGASPALARILKRQLEALYGESWVRRVAEIAGWRKVWRDSGVSGSELTARTEAAMNERGWLS